ncbi:mobile mystery protein B [Dongia sp.]|uniref:mobile mystery protein B n=1 Tax=Dongia sp. TaxID=1977262 RepID=UPI003752B423
MAVLGRAPDGATPLDPDEAEGLKFKHVTTRAELNALEQANIASGLLWLGRLRRRDILQDAFVRRLHLRLFGEVWRWAGQLRRTEKNIGVDPRDIAVQLRMLLDDARYWSAHHTYHPLEAAARFHHRMVQVHLFPNGNGRHARIAADVYLRDCFGHKPIDWAAGADLLRDNARRDQYIAALRRADAGEVGPLLSFVGL